MTGLYQHKGSKPLGRSLGPGSLWWWAWWWCRTQRPPGGNRCFVTQFGKSNLLTFMPPSLTFVENVIGSRRDGKVLPFQHRKRRHFPNSVICAFFSYWFNQVVTTLRITQVRLGQWEYLRPLESQFTCEQKEAQLVSMLKSAPSSLS